MKHKANILGLFAGITFSTVLFYTMQWQLDLWCSPDQWANKHWLEVLPFLSMWSTDAYVLAFFLLNVAYWIVIVSIFISLWTWDDEQEVS